MNQAPVTVDSKVPGVQTQRGRRIWLPIFAGGLALWVATVLVTFATQNSNLIPTIILLGSFLVPVTFVTYAFSHADPIITPQRIFGAFIVGGILGVLGASLLEAEFLKTPSAFTFLGVGLIEEAVKLAAVWLVARRLPSYSVRDGMVLGATVGFGFAAFESAGYAFNALFTTNGLSLLDVVETEVLRGVLTPIGHGVWTAILGAAMFAAASRRWRLGETAALLGWYLVVSMVHAVWDSSVELAVWLTLLLDDAAAQWLIIEAGHAPTVSVTRHTVLLSWVLVDGLLGLSIIIHRWRWAPTPTEAGTAAPRSIATAEQGQCDTRRPQAPALPLKNRKGVQIRYARSRLKPDDRL